MRITIISALLSAQLNLLLAHEFPSINKTFPALIDQFPKFDFIVHYDNTTKPDLDLLLNTPKHPVTLLVNYDEPSFVFARPVGHQFVNVVYMVDPLRFGGGSNLRYNDVVIFIMDNFRRLVPSRDLWTREGLNQSGCVILYDRVSEEFYYVHFYVGKTSGLLNKIRVKTGNDIPRLLRYMNSFRNFKGHVFDVGHFACPHFVANVKSDELDDCVFEGIDSKILDVLSNHLNFRFRLSTSEPNPEGRWLAMINDVHFRRLDWAIGGITRTVKRMGLVDFTSMLHMESYAVLYADKDDVIKSWDNALTPLEVYVWSGVITLACFVGLLLKVTSAFMGANTKLCDYVLMPFRTLTEQPIYRKTRSFSVVKILLGTWFLTSIIITTAYKSKLASSMITTVTETPNSILDLYNAGYRFKTDPDDWTVLKESLSEAFDTRYRGVLQRSKNDLRFCAAIKKLFDGKFAFVDEETLIQYAIWHHCKGRFTVNEISRLRKVRQKLLPSMHAWPLQKNAPFRFRFSIVFNKLVASGIIEYWYKLNRRLPTMRKKAKAAELSGLSITTFCGPAFILFAGVILSSVVFLCEHVHAHNQH